MQIVREFFPERLACTCLVLFWVPAAVCFPPIVDDIFHRSVFCKHWSGGGYEKWGDVLPVLVNCLFEEAPQIGGEIGVHQWLQKDWLAVLWWLQSSLPEDHFQCLLCGLFADVGEVACHTAQPEYAGGAGAAS